MCDIERPTVYAIDVSGSTSGSYFYHDKVQKIVDEMYKEGDIIILWESSSTIASKAELDRLNSERRGYGGTSPHCIFDLTDDIGFKSFGTFVLITDGEVDYYSIKYCDDTIRQKEITFKYVYAYIINSSPNMSVTCPFTRYCPNKVVAMTNKDNEKIYSDVTDEDLLTINEIQNIKSEEEFNNIYDKLEKCLTARCIGSEGDEEIRIELLKLQKRIIYKRKPAENKYTAENLIMAIENDNIKEALAEGKKLFDSIPKVSLFDRRINTLIRMSNGGLKNVFTPNEISNFRAKTAADVASIDIEDVEDAETKVLSSFVCPITYDDETDPAILVARPDIPLLTGISKRDTSFIIDCPLNSVLLKQFIESIKNHLDHPISLKSYREAEKTNHPITESPITRRHVIGAIPLGANKSHVEAADWTIAQLINNGKSLGQKDLWFAVLWMIVVDNKIPYLKELEPFMREQLIWRLKNRTTSASLCGMSQTVQERIPIGCACWFCLAEPFMNVSPTKNLVRHHLAHVDQLKRLVDLCKYKLPENCDILIERTKIAAPLLRMARRGKARFNLAIQALYQKAEMIRIPKKSPIAKLLWYGDTFIPVDGIADKEQIELVKKHLPKKCLNVPVKEIVYVASAINTKLKSSCLNIPLDECPEVPHSKSSWEHYSDAVNDRINEFKKIVICKNTCRPYLKVNDHEWIDEYKKMIIKDGPIFNCYSLYCKYCIDMKRKPIRVDEFIGYCYKRIVLGSKKAETLPEYVRKICETVFESFEELNFGVHTIIERFNGSANKEKRIELEK